MDCISHCSDDEGDMKSKASSQQYVQLCETQTTGEISCPTIDPFFVKDQSCEPACNLVETRIHRVFPRPEFDNMDSSEDKKGVPNVGSSNLSKIEYEELLRVYREKVW